MYETHFCFRPDSQPFLDGHSRVRLHVVNKEGDESHYARWLDDGHHGEGSHEDRRQSSARQPVIEDANQGYTRFCERKMMATIDRSVRTKRRATTNGARAARPAVERLRRQAREVSRDIQAMGGTARDAANEQLGQMRDYASEYYEQGRGKAHQMKRGFEQFIMDHPLKSLLIAAGVGLLFGRFWMRR